MYTILIIAAAVFLLWPSVRGMFPASAVPFVDFAVVAVSKIMAGAGLALVGWLFSYWKDQAGADEVKVLKAKTSAWAFASTAPVVPSVSSDGQLGVRKGAEIGEKK